MAKTTSRKRSANDAGGPSKKRKFEHAKKVKPEKQDKLADRGFIPIPADDDDDVVLSDGDMDMLDEFGGSVGFLQTLDKKGIMRSKKETIRLNELNKPVRVAPKQDSLPPIDPGDESDDWSSSPEIDLGDSDEDDDLSLSEHESDDFSDSDKEMDYEQKPRTVKVKDSKEREVQRLPIKLPGGTIKSGGTRTVVNEESEEESEDEPVVEQPPPRYVGEDGSTGARFGRPAVATVLKTSSRKLKIQLAKEQISGICNDILADPENSLMLLKRLHSFALVEVTVPGEDKPVSNDEVVRKLAILSQLAVFKDVIPGYRIRALTDKEKSEKVGQMVARTREWEQGLVSVYQNYLRLLDCDIKGRSPLADVAIHCMCILLTEVGHFNFRQNLMACIVARLSKRSWDDVSERCLNAVNSVFRTDLTGEASLEVVRILNRMVKERGFKIHPSILSCLLHLRLRTELNVRTSMTNADSADRDEKKKKKRKKGDTPHLSKNAKKTLKEQKEIQKELREAEAEVDKEERASTHTETLKLLFVLYFRILKHPTPSPLLPAALTGIVKFAHLVNIDFFKDLMKVLKGLMALESEDSDQSDDDDSPTPASLGNDKKTCHRLLCISTAFELLSGQGEALNIDLSDFITDLYAMLLPLSLLPNIDVPHPGISVSKGKPNSPEQQAPSIADLLFNTLNIVFSPRSPGSNGLGSPPWRAAAFAKRLLMASLHWPPTVTLRALHFVRALVAKHPKLEALLSTEDRTHNGLYRADVDDPQLCHALGSCLYELHLLQRVHISPRVGEEASKILGYTS